MPIPRPPKLPSVVSERTRRIMTLSTQNQSFSVAPELSSERDPLSDVETSGSEYAPDFDGIISSEEFDNESGNELPGKEEQAMSRPEKNEENKTEGPFPRKKRISVTEKEIRKMKRLRGESYMDKDGKILLEARPLQPVPCHRNAKHSRQFSCGNVGDGQRQVIHQAFRNLPSTDDQRLFINQHAERVEKKRKTVEHSRRNCTVNYYLTCAGNRTNVCMKFFAATLNVSEKFIRSSLNMVSPEGIVRKDMRGKHPPKHKLSESSEKFIRDFIESFSAIESHFCRKSSSKKYLDSSLNINTLHKLYLKKATSEGVQKVAFGKFRQIFRTYNLGFFRPKKDQCQVCLTYTNAKPEVKEDLEEKYGNHQRRKAAARLCRDDDKSLAENDPEGSTLSFNFDLQAVLCTPKGQAGQIFYLRKLAVYNFTIFNLASHRGHCFLWDETQGNRGSNEISTFLFLYIKRMIDENGNLKTVRMMSDSCGGQNKNSIVAAMCSHLLRTTSLETIRHTFFEVGHSEMECDSMHSKIEQKAKYSPVYTPEGWAQVIRCARSNPVPFEVTSSTYDQIIDFAALSQPLKKAIPWRRTCMVLYSKSIAGSVEIQYKEDYAEEFKTVVSNKQPKGRRRTSDGTLPKAYPQALKISSVKYKDLMKMCREGIIPAEYCAYYESLQPSTNVPDRLPEPDVEEESEYEEEENED